jgi:hypothetical protein
MENDDVTVVISERSTANLREVKQRQLTEKKFRYDRSNVVSRANLKKDRAKFATWLARANEHAAEGMSSKDEFLMEITAKRALGCFNDLVEAESTDERAKNQQARAIVLNKFRSDKKKEESAASENLHHPSTRMKLYFDNPTSTSEQTSVADDRTDSEEYDSTCVINEIVRLEHEREAVLVKADQVAWDDIDGNPFKQRANVHERMWMLVDEYDPIFKLCCDVVLKLVEEARKNHQQVAACMNCATVFVPFFPDDYHMHQRSAEFKTRIVSISAGVNSETLQKALVGLARKAGAYKKEGSYEYIKLIRVVKGARGHRAGVKYDRLELCENSNVECCQSVSEKKFYSRNLAVGILELVIQLHLKIPVSSKLLKPNNHGAGFADYFQRYRRFVPEFVDEVLFRCFLIEFGQHVRRTIQFDHDFKCGSDWWGGRSKSPDSTFLVAGCPGMLIKLDKHGLIRLAKSLAEGTLRVLDDFCGKDHINSDFLSCPAVGVNVELQEELVQIPAWAEDVPVELGVVPSLHPLCLADRPEVIDAERIKKISKTKLAKRAPDLTTAEVAHRESERRRVTEYRKKKAAADKLSSKRYLTKNNNGEVLNSEPFLQGCLRVIVVSPPCGLFAHSSLRRKLLSFDWSIWHLFIFLINFNKKIRTHRVGTGVYPKRQRTSTRVYS